MMKTMLGLPAGACANAGKFVAGKLSAARATLETSMLPILRLIFMIPDPPLRVLIRFFIDPAIFPQIALHTLCNFGINVLIRSF
jgi:hypothetical protein